MLRGFVRSAFGLLAVLSACTERPGAVPDGGGVSGDGDASIDGAITPGTDSGPHVPTDGGEFSGCRAVDVLFVIDDSASMADQQAALIASFEGFVEGMRERLADATSYHVGVVTSDDYFTNAAGCQSIGDLVTKTGGIQSSDRDCGLSPTQRYLTESDPDLTSKFACIAQVGVGGADDERMARAMLNAIDPARSCNAGFIREDALLVLVMISDEDDVEDGCTTDPGGGCLSYGSGGRPDDWIAELSTIRDPQSVVALTLIGRTADNDCGAVVAARLIGLTNRFPDGHRFLGDVCMDSYDEFFRESLPIIGEACEDLPF